MIVVTTQMNCTASPSHAPRIVTPALTDAVFPATGSVTVTTIAEMRAMNPRAFVVITPATLSRYSSVTRHASAFPDFGSVTGMTIVMMDRTRLLRLAKVRKIALFCVWTFLCAEPFLSVWILCEVLPTTLTSAIPSGLLITSAFFLFKKAASTTYYIANENVTWKYNSLYHKYFATFSVRLFSNMWVNF